MEALLKQVLNCLLQSLPQKSRQSLRSNVVCSESCEEINEGGLIMKRFGGNNIEKLRMFFGKSVLRSYKDN